jgi:hypothetical protein
VIQLEERFDAHPNDVGHWKVQLLGRTAEVPTCGRNPTKRVNECFTRR